MKDDDWISARTTNACRRVPLVTPAVLTRIRDLLAGELSQRQLSKKELARAAADLIAAMAPVTPKVEAEE